MKADVLTEHQVKTAEWLVRTVNHRNKRDFLRLTGELPGFNDEAIVRQFYVRQLGVVESLVDKLVKAAIAHYEPGDGMLGFNIKPHSYRAAFYAQDQVGVFFNELTRIRAQHIGTDGYIWVRTTAKNPRDFHLKRVGQFFRWGEVEDEPGVLPNCRCTAKPVRRGSKSFG